MFPFLKENNTLQTECHKIPLYKVARREINKFNMGDIEYGCSPVFPASDFKQLGRKEKKEKCILGEKTTCVIFQMLIKSNHMHIFTNSLHFSSQRN